MIEGGARSRRMQTVMEALLLVAERDSSEMARIGMICPQHVG